MRSRVVRLLRVVLPAALAGIVAMVVLAPVSQAATTPKQQDFVDLQGEGAWSIFGPLVSWQNELATASSYVNVNYVAHGSALGRQDVAAGKADFAISGIPFSDADFSGVKGGPQKMIDAPIQVATMATFVEPTFDRPVAQFKTVQVICDPDDDTTWPPTVTTPDGCIVRKPYTGPVRIPNRNLAAMFFHFNGSATPRLWAWNNGDILKAFGIDPDTTNLITEDINGGPGFAGRSDPDEITYYVQQYVKQAAPDVWQGIQDADRRIPWEPISERYPKTIPGVTRDGAEQQVNQLAQSGCGVDGKCNPQITGGVAPAPPAMMRSFKSAFPDQSIAFAQLQNANGDWVAPTPDSINAAVDAGGDTPLYALTNKVSGAYPLVWVDHLYAPAHGLSVAKTEGLAMMIRYLATTGQEKEQASGDGRLPQPLVAKALAAADALVTSNCTGSDRQIVKSSDPGPLAPSTATAMKSIGSMLHCEPAAPATTTTTIRTTTTVATATTVPFNSNGVSSNGTSSYVPPVDSSSSGSNTPTPAAATDQSGATDTGSGTDVVVGVKKSKTTDVQLVTATSLPLPAPAGASGTDRLAAFLLGVLLYLLLRRPVGRFAQRWTS